MTSYTVHKLKTILSEIIAAFDLKQFQVYRQEDFLLNFSNRAFIE